MDELENGVAPAGDGVEEDETEEVFEEEDETTPEDGGQNSDENKGTDDDDGVTPEEGDGKPSDPNIRINNLMSKWQKEESNHNKTKSELELYKQRFGSLEDEPNRQIGKDNYNEDDEDIPESFRDDWEPKDKADLQKAIKESAQFGAKQALKTIEMKNKAKAEAEAVVDDFITEVKEADPNFDEKVFYKYANNHNFPLRTVSDLRSVYSSYVELRDARAESAKDALKNKEKRSNNVNKPGGAGNKSSGLDASKIAGAHSASDLIENIFDK